MQMFSEFIDGLLNFHFLQNALITALVIGIVGGAVGCFIILRGMSLMGDAISHAVLPGVAISFILGINFFIGAIVFGLLASTIITYIKSNSIIKSDTAIGITFSSFLALGIILIGVANSSTDLFHILFGNILAVQDLDMWITIAVALLVLTTIKIFFRPLLLTSFDPILAKSIGVRVTFYHYLLMVILTLVAVTAMQSVGTILIVALLITPAATAYLYANSLKTMILLSSVFGALASVLGLNATQELGNRSKRDNQLFNIGLLLILLVSGLRYMHGDYGTYEMGFNEMKDVGNDWGYYQIQLLGKKIGLSFQGFVFLISLLAVYSYKKAFSINTFPNFCLVVILGKIFTLYAMSGIRQFIAIAICWWAIKILLDKQKILLFIAMTAIAYSLHASALIILPIVLFYKRKFSYVTALVIIIIALIISYSSLAFFASTADISDLVNERLSGYLGRTGNEETMNMLNYFENFLFLFLALVARKEAVKKVPYYDFFLYLFIIYCAFLIAGANVGIIKRLRDYYIISYAFIIPGIFYLFKEKRAQNITRLLFIAYFIFLFFRSLTVYDSAFHEDEYNRMVPYHSVLEMP